MVRMVVALVLMMVFSVAAQAEKRVALVVGNSAYKHAGTLSNPKNDADDMAAALKALDIESSRGSISTRRGWSERCGSSPLRFPAPMSAFSSMPAMGSK